MASSPRWVCGGNSTAGRHAHEAHDGVRHARTAADVEERHAVGRARNPAGGVVDGVQQPLGGVPADVGELRQGVHEVVEAALRGHRQQPGAQRRGGRIGHGGHGEGAEVGDHRVDLHPAAGAAGDVLFAACLVLGERVPRTCMA